MTETKTLHEKLVEVFKEVEYVAKKGKNEAQGYEYQRAADVANAVRMKLFERGVLIIPSEQDCKIEHMPTLKGGIATEVCLTVNYAVTDGKDTINMTAYGMARANDDKAIWKAKTGAQKYLLRGLGLIPDAKDDPEHETGADSDAPTAHDYESNFLDEDHHLPDKRLKALKEAIDRNGHSQMAQSKFLGDHGYQNWENVLNKDWLVAIQWASNPAVNVPKTASEAIAALNRSVDMAKAQKAVKSNCEACGERMIKAGVSKKTGKPYPAFCSSETCPTRQKGYKKPNGEHDSSVLESEDVPF